MTYKMRRRLPRSGSPMAWKDGGLIDRGNFQVKIFDEL